MINTNEDLIDLKNYLKNKFNLIVNLNVNNSKNHKLMKNIKTAYIYIFIIIILYIVFIYFLYCLSFNTKYNTLIKNYLVIYYISILIIFLLLSSYLFKYLCMIYFYNRNNNLYKNNHRDIKNIDFNTGDIIQETNWIFSRLGITLFEFYFLHHSLIFKFKNKNYILHASPNNRGHPENILTFDSKHIEICRLEDYFKDNSFSTKYYRIIKCKKKDINPDKIFDFLTKVNMKNINFSFIPCIKNCDNRTYNCITFILKILNHLNIIPKFNYTTFNPHDFDYLYSLSNNLYHKPFIMKV